MTRMTHPVALVPAAMKGLYAYGKSAEGLGVPDTTLAMVHLRASQINGCTVCVQMHATELRNAGETDDRIFTVAAWRDAPYFTEAERAALALAEAVTRVADRADPIPDDIWADAAKHYDEQGMAALLIAVSAVNVWNRLNAAVRQEPGVWQG